MEAERSIHCSMLCDIITKSNLGQRYKRELVHLQQRLFSTLSTQLTLQYSSSRYCGNAHPCTPKAGQLLGLLSFSLRAEEKEAAHDKQSYVSITAVLSLQHAKHFSFL